MNTTLNMSEISNKKSLNNGVKEAGTEGEGFSPSRCPVCKQRGTNHHPATARRKWSKKDNKMAILCYLQAKEGQNIDYKKRMHHYWRTMGCLSWGNNSWHAKLGVF